MKRIYILVIFIYSIQLISVSQNLDLIVMTNGDSIASRIDSITGSNIYFEVKYNKRWIHTVSSLNSVKEFQYGVINKKLYNFTPGTSYINSKPKISQDILENIPSAFLKDFIKAKKIKKTGATLSLAGVGAGTLGLLVAASGGEGGGYAGFYMILAGGAITLVGLPIFIGGASKVKSIEKEIKAEFGYIELSPFYFQDCLSNVTQQGVSLKIKF